MVQNYDYLHILFNIFKMIVDDYADQVAYEQGKQDECCRIICWIAVSLLILSVVIWLITWLTRPTYYPPQPGYMRHNLFNMKHQGSQLFGSLLSN
jgi:hypothetical protein